RAMFKHDVRVGFRPEKIEHDLIVASAVHPGFHVVALYPQRAQIALPCQRVKRHGIDHYAIQIEDQRQPRRERDAPRVRRVLRYAHWAEYSMKSRCNIKVQANYMTA